MKIEKDKLITRQEQKERQKAKKAPQRMCIVCRGMFDKNSLVRLVRANGEISLDESQKAEGRGAYICVKSECIAKLLKQKVLNRAFKCAVDSTVYDSIAKKALNVSLANKDSEAKDGSN